MENKVPFYKMNVSEIAAYGERVHTIAAKITVPEFTATQMLAQLATSNLGIQDAKTKLTSKQRKARRSNNHTSCYF